MLNRRFLLYAYFHMFLLCMYIFLPIIPNHCENGAQHPSVLNLDTRGKRRMHDIVPAFDGINRNKTRDELFFLIPDSNHKIGVQGEVIEGSDEVRNNSGKALWSLTYGLDLVNRIHTLSKHKLNVKSNLVKTLTFTAEENRTLFHNCNFTRELEASAGQMHVSEFKSYKSDSHVQRILVIKTLLLNVPHCVP